MLLPFAIELAYRAGEILRAGLQQARHTESKGPTDLVSDIDKASEAMLVAAIRQRFPSHSIVAEEGSNTEGDHYTWVIDPLDGTLNYVHGFPCFSVSIGLLLDGVPYLGVVYDPLRDELFSAERGQGAFCNQQPLRVSTTPSLIQSLLTTGFPYERASLADNNLKEFSRILMHAQDVRRPGSAALDMAYVAAGRFDGYWELGTKAWDLAAGAVLVTEAGGQITGWQGEAWNPFQGRIVATNGQIHAELLQLLKP
ncbi:MAG: inositol monophosphatase [Chloroflexaceae bacterium]|nr:inositol monophosphatase [Chloroflexaceae bacterium]